MKKKLLTYFILFTAIFTSAAAFAYTSIEDEIDAIKPFMSKKLRSCTPYTYKGDTFVASIGGMVSRQCLYKFFAPSMDVSCSIKASDLKNIKNIDAKYVCTRAQATEAYPQNADFTLYNILFK